MLEGLAASGLRSIRYALEIDGIARIDANDLDGAVVEVPRRLWSCPVVYGNCAAVNIMIGDTLQSSHPPPSSGCCCVQPLADVGNSVNLHCCLVASSGRW